MKTASTNARPSIEQAIQYKLAVEQAITQLGERKHALLAERSALHSRLGELHTGPVRRDEAKAFVLKSIDSLAAAFPQAAKWPDLFNAFSAPLGERPVFNGVNLTPWPAKRSGPLCLADIDALGDKGTAGKRSNILPMIVGDSALAFIGNAADPDHLQKALCFFFGDVVKSKVGEYFDRLYPVRKYPADGPDGGMSLAQRREGIGELKARHEEIAAELIQIDEQLDALKGNAPTASIKPNWTT